MCSKRGAPAVNQPPQLHTSVLHLLVLLLYAGFFDPFDVNKDVTLDNPAYRIGPIHLMAGKLDWCLLRGMRVLRKQMGNDNYAASDHKWLIVEVQLAISQQ